MDRPAKLVLLLLAGCGYSSYWPQGGPFADTGYVPPQVPCGTASGAPVELTLTSQLAEPLSAWRMDPVSCAEVYEGDLGPYGFGTWSSASGVVWFTRSAQGVTLRWFEVPGGVSAWTEPVP